MSRLVYKQWIYKPNLQGTPKALSGMVQYIATRPGVEIGGLRGQVPDFPPPSTVPADTTRDTHEQELEALASPEAFEERYVSYIATRPGVAVGESQPHGLFGRLSGMREMDEIDDLELTRGYIENLAHQKTTILNAVVSLTGEDAAQKDMTTREAWGAFIDSHIYEIAREMGIPPRALEWVAAVHLEKDHPHLHLMYWNREQSIGINTISPEKANNIRKSLTRDLFREEIAAVRQNKDERHKELVEGVKGERGILTVAFTVYRGLDLHTVYQMARTQKADGTLPILDRRTASGYLPELTERLQRIDAHLKEKYPRGALKYKYLPEELKKELEDLAKDIIRNNPEIAAAFNGYIEAAREQAGFYGGKKNVNAYVNTARYNIYKEVSNKILYTVKELRKIKSAAYSQHRQEWAEHQVEKQLAYERLRQEREQHAALMGLMQSALDTVCSARQSGDAPGGRLISNDLTKAQKAELAKKEKDRSLEWGE